MRVERKIPKRRFKEFKNAGAWEQRKVGEAGSFYYGHSCPKWSVTEDATTPCIRYGELYTKFGSKIDRVFSYTNMHPNKLRFSKGNEVLIPRVGEDPMDYNHCTWLSIPGVAIGEMISVYNTEQNPLFTATMFNATLQKEFAIRVEGGSVTNLYFEKLKSIEVYFPSMAEQEKIAAYFEQIDNLITLNQRKLEKLKALKKAYLSQMFPSDGERKPKLRFAGFNDEWKKRKLGEIVTIKSGMPPSLFERGNEFYVKVDDLNYSFREQNDTNIKVAENLRCSKIKKGSIIFPKRGAAIMTNKVRIMGTTGYMDTNMMALEPKEVSSEFLYLFVSMTGLYKIADTSTIPQINNKHIEPYEIIMPNIEEQKKIGSFFNYFDDLITLHQRKLEKLQNLKKAYLNEMFV